MVLLGLLSRRFQISFFFGSSLFSPSSGSQRECNKSWLCLFLTCSVCITIIFAGWTSLEKYFEANSLLCEGQFYLLSKTVYEVVWVQAHPHGSTSWRTDTEGKGLVLFYCFSPSPRYFIPAPKNHFVYGAQETAALGGPYKKASLVFISK